MTLSDAIISCPQTGNCTLDINLVKKMWTDKCCISRWDDNFRLYQLRNKNKIVLKVTIFKEDAERLIAELHLCKSQSEIFKPASTYRSSQRMARRS